MEEKTYHKLMLEDILYPSEIYLLRIKLIHNSETKLRQKLILEGHRFKREKKWRQNSNLQRGVFHFKRSLQDRG